MDKRREQADELERAWMVVRRVAINGIVTLDIVTDAADRLRASCDEPSLQQQRPSLWPVPEGMRCTVNLSAKR